MHVTKWGEYGILCSVYLARRYLAAHENGASGAQASGDALSSTELPNPISPIAVGATDVAESQRIPAQYTQQILQRLRRGDIVKSVRGARGGYVLSRHPRDITLLDIMRAAEGSTFDVMCETSPAYPDASAPTTSCAGGDSLGGCNLREVWFEVRAAIDQVLMRKTLEQLAQTAYNGAANTLVSIGRPDASLK